MKVSYCVLLPLAAIALLTLAGCGEEVSAGRPHTHDPALEITLCGHCGEVKGSDDCCQDEVPACSVCGLHKGSILCCSSAIQGVRDVILCRECGEIRFTDACCQDAQTCAKCGLHEGSPGCCKIQDVPIDHEAAISHSHSGEHRGH